MDLDYSLAECIVTSTMELMGLASNHSTLQQKCTDLMSQHLSIPGMLCSYSIHAVKNLNVFMPESLLYSN